MVSLARPTRTRQYAGLIAPQCKDPGCRNKDETCHREVPSTLVEIDRIVEKQAIAAAHHPDALRKTPNTRGRSVEIDVSMKECRVRTLLLEQFDIAWSLAVYHLEGLTTEECLWEPTGSCIRVRRLDSGKWRADWPESEGYEIGPPSIAWTTWHICYWWTKAIRQLESDAPAGDEDVPWPGDAEQVRAIIQSLRDRWRSLVENCDEADLQKSREDSWPIPNSSLDSIAAWLNVELMKNAAEIGVMRFLYAASQPSRDS